MNVINSEQNEMRPEQYIKERIDDQIDWYDHKSSVNKQCFYIFQIVILIASASIPVLSIFSIDMRARVLIAVFGSVTAIATGIVSLYKFRENWIEYRTTAESLKHEKYMFQTKAGCYIGDDSLQSLVERTEMLISQENTSWRQRLTLLINKEEQTANPKKQELSHE